MPISIRCPECGRKLSAPDGAAGKRARCPHCKTIVTLPSAAAPPPEEVLDAEPMAAPPEPQPVAAPAAAPEPEPDFGDIPLADEKKGYYPPPMQPRDMPLAPATPGGG